MSTRARPVQEVRRERDPREEILPGHVLHVEPSARDWLYRAHTVRRRAAPHDRLRVHAQSARAYVPLRVSVVYCTSRLTLSLLPP